MLDTYPIIIPGGVVKDASRYALRGRWVDSDKIRFRMGKPEGIGGWARAIEAPLLGRARHLGSWVGLTGVSGLFAGTSAKAYVWVSAENLYDITPIVASGSLVNPISTTASTQRVGVALPPGTPKSIGTFIRILGASATGGIPAASINGEREISEIVGNTVFFQATSSATSTVAAGGGAVTYEIDYPAGNADTQGLGGWGASTWGSGGWGGTGISTSVPLGFWQSDNWGEDLLISPRGGPIFYWDATTPTARAIPISGMPGAAQVPISADRVIIWEANRIALAFATNSIGSTTRDPLLVRWSDNENYLAWDPTVPGSAAGEFRLSVGSRFVAALKAPNEILAWTDVGLHAITPSGGPSVFDLRVISPRTAIYGPKAMVVVGDAVYWAGSLGFFRYAGSVQAIPCPIEEFMRARLDTARSAKIVAAANAEFSEVAWIYPSLASPDGEPDSYVKYNFVENLWDVGTLNRTAWMDSGTFDRPVAVMPNGTVLFHEVGVDDLSVTGAPASIGRYIRHGPIEIDGKGNNFIATRWLLPDISFINPSVSFGEVFITPYFSYGSGSQPVVPPPAVQVTTNDMSADPVLYPYQHRMRGRGRDVAMLITSDRIGVNWRLGDNRIVGRPDGRR